MSPFHSNFRLRLILTWIVFFLLFIGEDRIFSVELGLLDNEKKKISEVWEEMKTGEWTDVEKLLNEWRDSGSEDALCQVYFARGYFWQSRQPGADFKKAEENFDWIVKNHPHNSVAPWAMLAEARLPDLIVLAPKFVEASKGYRRVLEAYPESDAAQEAVIHLAQALYQIKGKAGALEGIEQMQTWLKAHPNPKYASEIWLNIGKLYRYPIEDYVKAVDYLSKAYNEGVQNAPQELSLCWTIAYMAETKLHNKAMAIEYYTKFIQKYPHHKSLFMAKEGLQRLGAPIPATEDMTLEGIKKRYSQLSENGSNTLEPKVSKPD
jgi:outer membrane protein assembly factor BamD (BamD/ComL family)